MENYNLCFVNFNSNDQIDSFINGIKEILEANIFINKDKFDWSFSSPIINIKFYQEDECEFPQVYLTTYSQLVIYKYKTNKYFINANEYIKKSNILSNFNIHPINSSINDLIDQNIDYTNINELKKLLDDYNNLPNVSSQSNKLISTFELKLDNSFLLNKEFKISLTSYNYGLWELKRSRSYSR